MTQEQTKPEEDFVPDIFDPAYINEVANRLRERCGCQRRLIELENELKEAQAELRMIDDGIAFIEREVAQVSARESDKAPDYYEYTSDDFWGEVTAHCRKYGWDC